MDALEDSAANITACIGASPGHCNFRSAVACCVSVLSSLSSACTVALPADEALYMDRSLGGLNVAAARGSLAIEGNGCRSPRRRPA